MVVLTPQAEVGHAPPPQTPYSIITNLKDWDTTKSFREGNADILSKLVHIYPRFTPTHYGRELSVSIAKNLGMEEKGVFMYLNPIMWGFTKRHITLPQRGANVLSPDEVQYRCVDIGGHRLYVTLFDPAKRGGIMLSWAIPGIGVSIRGSEMLLSHVDAMKEVPVDDITAPPQPTFTPEGPSHVALRKRISSLLHRATIDPHAVQSSPEDVFLYPTGMAAIFHVTNTLLALRPGTVAILGVVFHNTYTHLREESLYGWEHFGAVDDEGINTFEKWLETTQGEKVCYAIVEFPGNPTLDTPDLKRLKKLSEKFGFVFIVDETIASYANVDVLPYSDLILTSLTKSFNGQADAMGGAIALNPESPHYATLSTSFTSDYRNELFAADADVLLRNSEDLLQRQATLNRNAALLAEHLNRAASDPESPVTCVQHPSVLPSKAVYDAYLRRPTPDFPEPGYGCLLTVELEDVATARAFHDACGFYPSPHIGAHVTIQLAYNMAMHNKNPEDGANMRRWKVKEESVRISAGLESAQDLVDTITVALEAAKKAKLEASRSHMTDG